MVSILSIAATEGTKAVIGFSHVYSLELMEGEEQKSFLGESCGAENCPATNQGGNALAVQGVWCPHCFLISMLVSARVLSLFVLCNQNYVRFCILLLI